METIFWVWLAVLAVTLLIEIVTLDLVSIWFSFGAVIPFILSSIDATEKMIEVQIAIFVVVSALLIIFVRKYAQKWLLKNMNTKTNIDSLVGKKFRLLEATDFEKNGSLKVNDVIWTAVGENGEVIQQGAIVEVTRVDGNKLVVKEVKENIEQANNEEDKNIKDNNKTINEKEVEVKKDKEKNKIESMVENDVKNEDAQKDIVNNGEEE